MDYSTFAHIKSLLETLRKPEYEHYRRAFKKMAKKLKKRKEKGKKQPGKHKTKIRKYFGLLSLVDWWYLVFRTHKGRGAYLLLRLIKEHPEILDAPIDDNTLWSYLTNEEDWDQAEDDSDDDELPDTDPDTNEAENDIGPLPFPPPGGGW